MSRTVLWYRDRRPARAAWTLAALAIAACGKPPAKPVDQSTGSTPESTPVVLPASASGPVPSGVPTVDSRPATFEEGELTFKSGNYDEAKTVFEKYVGGKPLNPWGHYMLGLSAWKSGDLSAAEKAFDRALELDSTQVKSYLGSARVLLDSKRPKEALERIEKALTIDSVSSEAIRLLARAHSATGSVELAIDTYRRALVLDDKDVWALNNLGVLYLDEGNPESAVGPLARAVELKSTAPVYRNNLGMALERTGHLKAAKAEYEAAVKADSTYLKAIRNRDRVAALVEDPADTERDFAKDQAEVFRLLVQMWKERK